MWVGVGGGLVTTHLSSRCLELRFGGWGRGGSRAAWMRGAGDMLRIGTALLTDMEEKRIVRVVRIVFLPPLHLRAIAE